MMNWLQGFLQFRAWLPDQLLALVEPSGKVDALHVRTLLALAIAAFLWSFVARTLWGVGLAVRDWQAGRRLVLPVATPLSSIAWLVGAVATTLPWLALWLMSRQGHVSWGLVTLTATLALVWATLRIGDRSRVFLLPAHDCLVVTRALPGLRVAEHRIPLAMVLPSQTVEPQGGERHIAAFLQQQLGSDVAVAAYLRKVAKRRNRDAARRQRQQAT